MNGLITLSVMIRAAENIYFLKKTLIVFPLYDQIKKRVDPVSIKFLYLGNDL